VRQFIESQGWEAGEVYSDIDISGLTEEKRPGFLKLKADYKTGKFDVAVADDFSRFSRNKSDAMALLGSMKIATAKEGVADSDNDFVPALHFLLADKFSKDMSKRWRHALMHRFSKGLPPSGKVQFGYDKTADGTYIQNADAATLKEAHERYTAGEGVRSICEDFSVRGLPAPGPRGWYSEGMFDLLDKVFYSGKVSWTSKKGEAPIIMNGAHEAILSPGEWAAYRKAREDRKANLRPKNPRWWLPGLVECGKCGGKMVSHADSRGTRQLMCSTYSVKGKKACSGVFRRQSVVSTRVWFWLGAHLEEWASAMPSNEEAHKAAEKALLDAQAALIAAKEEHSDFVQWAFANRKTLTIDPALAEEREEAINNARAAVEEAQAHLASLVPATDVHDRILEGSKLMGFEEDLESEPSEQATARLREAVSRIIEAVVVLPSAAKSPRDPDRNHAEEVKIVPRMLS